MSPGIGRSWSVWLAKRAVCVAAIAVGAFIAVWVDWRTGAAGFDAAAGDAVESRAIEVPVLTTVGLVLLGAILILGQGRMNRANSASQVMAIVAIVIGLAGIHMQTLASGNTDGTSLRHTIPIVTSVVLFVLGLRAWFRRDAQGNGARDAAHERHGVGREHHPESARPAEGPSVTQKIDAVMEASTAVAIVATDSKGLITHFNRGAERMFGYTAGEMIGRQTPAILHEPAELLQVARELSAKLGRPIEGFEVFVEYSSQQGGEERDWTCIRKDVTSFTASLVLTRMQDDQGRLTGLLGVAMDISARKQAERELLQREEHSRLIVETAHVAFIETDAAGVITGWNPRAEAVFGWLHDEVVGRSLAEAIVPHEERARHADGMALFLAADDQPELRRRIEMDALHRTGCTFPVEMTVWPLQTHEGLRFNALVHDITERRLAEAQLLDAKEAAEEATHAKSDFLASMSHEIRTPLNGVIGMANLLLDMELGARQREIAATIHHSGESLLNIINNVLDFSKIEARRLELETLDFDLRTIIHETLELIAPRAQANNLELVGIIDPAVPNRLRGDPGRLRQILVNLAGNAVKFTPKGEIVVRVFLEKETDANCMLRFVVTDTGIGIPPDALERLFEAFTQADRTISRKFGGTGLGLAICRQLVGMMDGEIGVVSNLGHGSAFHFTVTLSRQPGPDPEAPVIKHSDRRARVLVVDDNATQCEYLELQLGAWQLQSTRATGVDDALAKLCEVAAGDAFEIALIDAGLVADDPFALVRAIRQDSRLSRTKCILLTPLIQPLRDADLHAAGVAACVSKPLSAPSLFDTISTVISGRGEVRRDDGSSSSNVRGTTVTADGRKLRVLVADDNSVNRQVAMGQLSRLGHRVDVVCNGLEVIEALQRICYDVVFMDCMMPEMDGYEAAIAIRHLELAREPGFDFRTPVHVVAMTANAMSGDREKCLGAGMNDFISKPARPEDIKRVLDNCPSRGRETVPDPSTEPTGASIGASEGRHPAILALRAQASDAPVDLGELSELYADDMPQFVTLLEEMIEQSEKSCDDLGNALACKSADEVVRLAHTWRGACLNCGVISVVPALRSLEEAARCEDLFQVELDYMEVDAEWLRAREYIRKIICEITASANLDSSDAS